MVIAAIGEELRRCEEIFKNEEDPAISFLHGRLHIALRMFSAAVMDRPETSALDNRIATLAVQLFPEELIPLIKIGIVSEFIKKAKEFAEQSAQTSDAAP